MTDFHQYETRYQPVITVEATIAGGEEIRHDFYVPAPPEAATSENHDTAEDALYQARDTIEQELNDAAREKRPASLTIGDQTLTLDLGALTDITITAEVRQEQVPFRQALHNYSTQQ